MPTEQQIRDAWTDHRPYLVDMAFRMLGDIGLAEDVVQEAFHRLSQSDFDAIDDARGWLIVVTSRLCLGRHPLRPGTAGSNRSADRSWRSRPSPNPPPRAGTVDPADRVTLDDGVRLALLVVLERLSPPSGWPSSSTTSSGCPSTDRRRQQP